MTAVVGVLAILTPLTVVRLLGLQLLGYAAALLVVRRPEYAEANF
jgi:hypothetical protein